MRKNKSHSINQPSITRYICFILLSFIIRLAKDKTPQNKSYQILGTNFNEKRYGYSCNRIIICDTKMIYLPRFRFKNKTVKIWFGNGGCSSYCKCGESFWQNYYLCGKKSSMPHDATLILPKFYMCLIFSLVLGVSLIIDVFLRYQHPVVI